VADYALIRDIIERTWPDKFRDFNARLFTPGGFHKGNAARERRWETESGRAEFTAPDTLTSLGQPPEGGHADPRHPALERPVQHHGLRVLRPAAGP
jgi:hypothetical protein